MSRWLLGLVVGTGLGWGVGHRAPGVPAQVAAQATPGAARRCLDAPFSSPPAAPPPEAAPAGPDRADAVRLPWPDGELGDGEPTRFEAVTAEVVEACGGEVTLTDCAEYPCFAVVEGDVSDCAEHEGFEGLVTVWVPCPEGDDLPIQVLLGSLDGLSVHPDPDDGLFAHLPELARVAGRRLDDAAYQSLDRCE